MAHAFHERRHIELHVLGHRVENAIGIIVCIVGCRKCLFESSQPITCGSVACEACDSNVSMRREPAPVMYEELAIVLDGPLCARAIDLSEFILCLRGVTRHA